MDRNGTRISKSRWSIRQVDEIGAGRRFDRGKLRDRVVPVGHFVVGLALALTLAGCQSLFGAGPADIDSPDRPQTKAQGYPDLATIPLPSSPGNPLEERRQIVRDLIENRDMARYKKAVVRHRSGLSTTPPPAAPALSDARAEEIIRGAPVEDAQVADEAAEDDSVSGPSYRRRTQFDDGTLDDFIRRLKRDTTPPSPEPLPTEGGSTSFLSEEVPPLAWHFIGRPTAVGAEIQKSGMAFHQPVVLRALAAPARREGGLFAIRLAAADDDAGFFCSYLGWMVAWSSACIDENDGSAQKNDDLSADVDEDQPAEDGTPAGSGGSSAKSGSSAKKRGAEESGDETVAESDGSAENEVVASEDLDDGATVLPGAGALDRLRDLLRSRGRRKRTASDPKSLSYEADALKPPEEAGPPLPRSRPEVEEDFQIVRNDVLFEFARTPRPAFKPTQPEPATVIFPPKVPRRSKKTIFIPEVKPQPAVVAHQDLVQKQDEAVEQQRDAGGSAIKSLDEVKASVTETRTVPATVAPLESEDALLLDSEVILFDPASAQLPMGIEVRLAAMLKDANARQGKLFIVSKAEVGRLAMERARSVGLALVRLGATADVIEYDIVIARNADLVRVLLKPAVGVAPDEAVASDLEKVK